MSSHRISLAFVLFLLGLLFGEITAVAQPAQSLQSLSGITIVPAPRLQLVPQTPLIAFVLGCSIDKANDFAHAVVKNTHSEAIPKDHEIDAVVLFKHIPNGPVTSSRSFPIKLGQPLPPGATVDSISFGFSDDYVFCIAFL
jgi:hypothetical protein